MVSSYDDHLLTLVPDLPLTLPVGAAMRDALHSLAEQMLAYQYPAHPNFDPDRTGLTVRPADVRVVLDYVRKAVEDPEGRVEVERSHRATVRRIANPLQLGEMHEATFVLGRHWVQHGGVLDPSPEREGRPAERPAVTALRQTRDSSR